MGNTNRSGQTGEALLEELAAALDVFENAARDATAAALDRGSDFSVMQLGETAADVLAMGRRFVDAQRAAASAIADTAESLESVSPGAEWIVISDDAWPELGELRIVWKTWFFFVRALCDKAYRLLDAAAESRPARRGGSMSRAAASPASRVAVMLATEQPGFLPWFIAFRDRRDAVKEGVNFTCTALGPPGISITFNEFRIDAETGRRQTFINSDANRVTLADVVEDVRQLVGVLKLVAASYTR